VLLTQPAGLHPGGRGHRVPEEAVPGHREAHHARHAGPWGERRSEASIQPGESPPGGHERERSVNTQSIDFYTTRGVAPWWSGERMPL